MAFMPQAKTDEEIRALTVSKVKAEYQKLATIYNKILNLDYVYCHKCNEHLSSDTFYSDKNYKSGYFPICKKCLLAMVEQRDKKNDEPNETKESVQRVLQLMDLPYIDSFYENCVKGAQDGMKERNRKSPFSTYITAMKSLPNWKGLVWKDSEFEENNGNIATNQKAKQKSLKFFGNGFSDADYVFLQEQYDDWKTRYSIENKAMEEIVKRICFKQLDLLKAQQANRDTKELDKTFQDLLGSANLKPNQNRKDTLSDAQTFGQLIQKWEDEKPIPECEEDFKDIDKIGLYMDVFFKGHLAKMLNLKNPLSHIYEKFMKKYTVNKPEYDSEENSEALFDVIFGSADKDDKL